MREARRPRSGMKDALLGRSSWKEVGRSRFNQRQSLCKANPAPSPLQRARRRRPELRAQTRRRPRWMEAMASRLHQGQADLQEWMLRRSLRKATQGHRRGSDRVGLASLGKATGMYSRPEPVRVWKQKGALAGAVSARKKFKCRTFLFELFTFLITFSKTLELLKFERRTFLSAAREISHSRGHAMAQRRKVVGKTPEKESAKGVKVEPAEGGVGPAGPASAADDKAKLPSTRCPAGSFGVACGLGACRRRWVPPSESGRT